MGFAFLVMWKMTNFKKTEYLALGSAGLNDTVAFRMVPDKPDTAAIRK